MFHKLVISAVVDRVKQECAEHCSMKVESASRVQCCNQITCIIAIMMYGSRQVVGIVYMLPSWSQLADLQALLHRHF